MYFKYSRFDQAIHFLKLVKENKQVPGPDTKFSSVFLNNQMHIANQYFGFSLCTLTTTKISILMLTDFR